MSPRLPLSLIAPTILIGLWLEARAPLLGALCVGAWTWALLGWLAWRSPPVERSRLIACLALATCGELVLSLGLELYTYRLGGLPLFVPPGHALLFALGQQLAARTPRGFAFGVAGLACGYAVFSIVMNQDTISVPLGLIFVLCVWRGEAKVLYAVMFLLSLTLELFGTSLGAWTWRADPGFFGLVSANPPLAAGAFYCLLDLLVLVATRRAVGRLAPHPSPAPSS